MTMCTRYALYVHEHQGVRKTYNAPVREGVTPPQTITRGGKTYQLHLISTITAEEPPQ